MSIITKIHRIYKTLVTTLHLKGCESLYPFYKNRLNTPKTHWQYSLNAQQIYGENRQPGLSGYYRLYNEADFLEASVLSHLPFFDELVLVHDSTSTDKTPQIAQALARQYPDKIKYFLYQPEAFKLASNAYKILPVNHPNSFVNYYNFALSKTTKNTVAKVDGDHIAIDTQFAKIIPNCQDNDFMQNTFYYFNGINLWYIDGEIYVDPIQIPGGDGGGDHGFHPLNLEKHYYTKSIPTELGGFICKNRQWKNAGTLYFHLKNMRRDIPYHSYRGLDDKTHQAKFKKRLLNTQKHLVDWQTFVSKYQQDWLQKTSTDIKTLPDPNDYLKALLKTIPSIDSSVFFSK